MGSEIFATRQRPVKIALVEDHGGTRAALEQIIADRAPQLELVLSVADGEALLRELHRQDIDVLLIDLGLPGMSGCSAMRAVADKAPTVRMLALTAFDDEHTVFDAMRAGAFGYLLKDEPTERLVRAIEEAADGAHPVSSRVAGFLIAHARQGNAPVTLSDREEELARALAQGLSYAESAAQMGIALGTVQDYVKRIYRKLNVNSKKEMRQWVERYLSDL